MRRVQRNAMDKALGQLRGKLWRERIIRIGLVGILAAGVWTFGVLGLSFATPLIYVEKKVLVGSSLLVLGSVLIGLLRPPSMYAAARCGDRLGMEERFVTYLEYKHTPTPLMALFIQEAEAALQKVRPVANWRLRLPNYVLICVGVLLLADLILFMLPSPTREIAYERERIQSRIRTEEMHVEKLRQMPATMSSHTEEALDTLAKELARATTYQEAASAVATAESKLAHGSGQQQALPISAAHALVQGTGITQEDLAQTAGIVQWAQEVSGGKDRPLPNEIQQKMFENIENIKKSKESVGFSSRLQTASERLQSGSMTAEQLGELLKESAASAHETPETEAITNKLEQMKERLLALAGDTGQESDGETAASSVVFGDKKGLTNGEQAQTSGTESTMAGGGGTQARQNPNGVGGTNAASSPHAPAARTHEMAKGEEATRLSITTSSSLLQGSWSDQGNIRDGQAKDVWADVTGDSPLGRAWVTFHQHGMEYIDRQAIPLTRERLVQQYFVEVSGGKKNGTGRD
ncbi:hypothetical protein JQN58_01840 [Aneurinibacillus sp. BA2021]|nr:hypothetical protein [Aneurinibacillus sp. BA2021]